VSEGKQFWFGIPYCKIKQTEPIRDDYPVYVWILSEYNTNVRLVNAYNGEIKYQSISANGYNYIPLDDSQMNNESEVVKNYGYYLESDDPVSVYLYFTWRWSGEVLKVFPLESLGMEYMTMNLYQDETDELKPAQILVIATENNTTLTYKPTYNTEKCSTGQEKTVTLFKGQTYLILGELNEPLTQTWTSDLTGTDVKANKPFAVISGHTKGAFPLYQIGLRAGWEEQYANYSRNMIIEMLPPVEYLGNEYISIPINYTDRTRGLSGTENDNGDLIRFVAAYDSTVIYQMRSDGSSFMQISPKLNKGQWYNITNQENAAYYRSNKPVLVGQYGKSWWQDPGTMHQKATNNRDETLNPYKSGLGMLMDLIPIERWSSKAFFYSIPALDNYMVLNFRSEDFENIYFDNVKLSNSIGSSHTIPGTDFKYIIVNVSSGYHTVKGINNAKFACNFYGNIDREKDGMAYGTLANYTYGNLCNDSVSISDTNSCITNIDVKSIAEAIDIQPDASCASITSYKFLGGYNYTFIPQNDFKQGDKTFNFKLHVINQYDTAYAFIEITSGSGNTFSKIYNYYPEKLTPLKANIDFIDVKPGIPKFIDMEIKNTSKINVSILNIHLLQNKTEFTLPNVQFPKTLVPNESFVYRIEANSSDTSGTILIDSLIAELSCYPQTLAALRIGKISSALSLTSVEWHNAPPGVETAAIMTITNSGISTEKITSISWQDYTHFTRIQNISLPYSLGPGAKVDVTVNYKPSEFNKFNSDIATITTETGVQLNSSWNGYSAAQLTYKAILVSPVNNITGISKDTILTWQALSGIDSYSLIVSPDNAFSTLKLDTIVNSVICRSLFDPNTIYYWKVCGYVSGIDYLWSDTWNFTTRDEAGVIDSYNNNLYIDVVPNPITGSGIIRCKLNRPGNFNITIFNLLGLPVAHGINLSTTNESYNLDYDFGNLPVGVYYIVLQSNGMKANCRFTVIR
jgi:hypothetical protein